jgi:predicted ester cyclase
VEDLIAEGDKLMALIICSGIDSGDFQGLPPTGKKIVISAFIVERIKMAKRLNIRPF